MSDKSLLIFHQGALGDVVLTFPALIRLKKHFTVIEAVCRSQLGELAKQLGLIDNWFSQDAARFASLYSDAVAPSVKDLLNRYDEIILFSFSTDLTRSINQIRRRPTHQIPPRPHPTDNIHVAVHLLKNLAGCGLIEEDNHPIHPESSTFYRPSVLVYDGLHSRNVLLHPGAGSHKKMWPLSNFVQLERRLETDGYRPEYILGPAERFLEDELRKAATPQRVVHFPENIPALAALLTTAGGYIGNDSGVSHLAAYLELPTVAVFGPSNPQMWRPIGPRVRIVRWFHQQHESLPCRNNPASPERSAGLTPAAVLDTLYSISS